MRRLSTDDLAEIRAIVREEIERALGRGEWEPQAALAADPAGDPASEARLTMLELRGDPELRDHPYRVALRKHWAQLEGKRKERAARPVPDTLFIDIYDARRLLNSATGITANAWIRRGRLKRHRIDGRLRISRAEVDAILAKHRRKR